ncbi:CLIP domain-containing serine protease B4-like [Arctopsyche grandis]|uniref:CLIP domain-containing serine protease B4-like n=1 Tax=Arctopsyche grandis TaxID=121162 RepID=UPI00406D63FA
MYIFLIGKNPFSHHPKSLILDINKVSILPSKCGEYENDRLTQGMTGIFEYPWMALVASSLEPNLEASFICAGSIIHEKYILTAAHCLKFANANAKVCVGEYNIKTDIDYEGLKYDLDCASPSQDIEVEETVIHPMFNKPERRQNDIALLKLKTPIDFTKNNAMAMCLPLSEKLRNLNVIGLDMIVAGWSRDNDKFTGEHIQSRIPVVDSSNCNRTGRTLSQNQFCAKDFCEIFSGGPVMRLSDVNHLALMVQYGIFGYGPSTCHDEIPAVYTNVAKYVDWILDRIKN